MTFVLPVGAILLLFLASATIILLVIGPSILLKPRRRTPEFYRALHLPTTPSELHLPSEEIAVPIEEGISLSSWLIRADPPVKGTVLYLHGVADCKIDGLRLL